MQLLIVHRDAEMGDQLVQMVRDYTRHDCDLASSDSAALEWGHHHLKCALLLTQLAAEGIDGLTLGGALSEIFSGLQVLFLPAYALSERQLEVAETKVFPEPIDGDALLGAIERAEKAGTCSPDSIHIVDLVQMCCLGGRSGALQIVKEKQCGLVFLRNGRLWHAETTTARGTDALFEMVEWENVEFAYDQGVRAPAETVTVPWDEVLIAAVTLHKRQNILTSTRPERA
jgi:CheY-like chemotaxis protein